LRNPNNHFSETDIKKTLRISKWLSNLSPGFAHIVLGEYRSGYIIYFINYLVQFFLGGFASVFIWNQPIKLICFGEIMLVCFIVWFILSKIDYSYIVECTISLEKKSSEETIEERLLPNANNNQDLQGAIIVKNKTFSIPACEPGEHIKLEMNYGK
jgi:hypothetical protein